MNNIHPLSYSIPLKKIKPLPRNISKDYKQRNLSALIPGKASTYIYITEDDYYKQYEESKYAVTKKKGGWDCLRHYEILANNCIPIFPDLDKCPKKTMTNFPKELLIKIHKRGVLTESEYRKCINDLHNYTKQYLTCESSARYLLETVGANKITNPKILMINNNLMKDPNWANYSQYLITIGLRNTLGSDFIEYPKNKILYENYVGPPGYGRGFTYSRMLEDIQVDRTDISKKIINKEYDYIVYGLMGADEKEVGDIRRNAPLWKEVHANYHKNKIVFVYGGDASHSIKNNRYLNHLSYHSNFGTCFVRELDI